MLLGAITMTSGLLVFGINLLTQWVPRSVPAGATLATLVLASYARATWRRLHERGDEGRHDVGAKRVIVIGAGEAGRELLWSMLRDPSRTWLPVGLLDDDPHKRHRRLRHVPVLGTTDQLIEQVRATGAEAVVIAIPSAPKPVIARLRLAALEAKVDIKVLPATTAILNERVGIRDLRDINLNDVLGRSQLDTDVEAIAGYLAGKRVLVTGAGGSIGAELCRQIMQFAPGALLMLDRDESALHAVQLSIRGRALLDSDDVILCDIRDANAVNTVFAKHRPQVVFHAAALKHLPMLEQYPAEAVKTNVLGTRIVLDAADLVGVDRFVNISTDKAANPCSVLGYSKRVAERLTATRAASSAGTFLSVRFGNVLGVAGLRAHVVRPADRLRRTGDGHPLGGHALLHDHRGGLPAGHPGRGDRLPGRGARAGDGGAGADPGRRPPADPAVGSAGADRVHRSPGGREAARGSLRRPRAAAHPAAAPAGLPRSGAQGRRERHRRLADLR